MIAADDGVPHAILRDLGAIEFGTGRDVDRIGPINREALEAAEEVQLVVNDRAADRAAPPLILRVRLRESLLLGEEILRRQAAILEEAECAAPKLIRARLGDRV